MKAIQSRHPEGSEQPMSSRVERFRQKRIIKKRTITAILLFFFLLTGGMLVVDYGTNYLVEGNEGGAIAAVKSSDDSIEIKIMNRSVFLNKKYISRDLKYLKDKLDEIF